MKNKQMLGLTPTLPHELIEEILLRLPVRSLLLFKCVCKSWLTLISDPQFAKSHFDLAAAPTHCYLIESHRGSLFGSIDIEASVHEDCDIIYFCYSYPPLPSDNNCYSYYHFQILGSCRGFILLRDSDDDDDDLLVWNPSTGAQKSISCSHYHSLIKILYGFGYDASTDDYLVIIVMIPPGHSYSSETHFMVFSLKTNSLNKVEGIDFPYLTGGEKYSAGLLFNGALHWLAFPDDNDDHTNDDTEVAMIIAFDLTERSLSVIPLPCLAAGDLIFEIGYHLMVIGGCLVLNDPATTVCWVMKEYKVHSSWTKATHYSHCNYEGGVIIGSDAVGNLMKLNDNRELVVHSKNSFYIQSLQFAMYRESLLSLPSDFEKASEDDQH